MSGRVFKLGRLQRGQVVEVSLSGSAANVLLVDNPNLSNYQRGRRVRYLGGHYTKSPVRLPIPSTGTWNVVVDHGGYGGRTRAEVRVLRGPLPPGPTLQPRQPAVTGLSEIADNIAELVDHDDSSELLDVFVSHASEDKAAVARPLSEALRERGLSVWYDEFSLRVGDSLRRKIDDGLRRSRFGVVILSAAFFRKNWAQYELDGLVTLSVTGRQVLLPIWHGVGAEEVTQHSPSLADKVALSTADMTVAEIATEIADVIGEAEHG